MKDMDKTKEELLAEIAELKQRIGMLEKAEADRSKVVVPKKDKPSGFAAYKK